VVSGISTDIGMIIGYSIRSRITKRKYEDGWRIFILGPIWMSYLAGAFVGSFAHARIGPYTLFPPAVTLIVMGILWLIAIPVRKYHKNKKKERDNINTEEVKKL
jgi:uncharacterized membrane protein YoaK (UPF0700 family)